jgi:hypothetical protein
VTGRAVGGRKAVTGAAVTPPGEAVGS